MIVPAPSSIRHGLSHLATFLFATLTATAGLAGQSDSLSFGTGINTTWDRFTQPSSSPVIQLTVANTNDDLRPILYGLTLGLSFEPVGGATGSLAISTVTNAATDPVFTSGIKLPQINPFPGDGYTSISVENFPNANAPVPQGPAGLIGFTLSSADAIGTFNIVVQSFDDGLTSWNNFDAEEFSFANAHYQPLTVGQITVTAVPEPSTLALVGVAGCVALVAGVRRARSRREAGCERECSLATSGRSV